MNAKAATSPSTGLRKGPIVAGVVAIGLVAAMALDTTVVVIGSERDARAQGFSPESFGDSEFPKVRAYIVENAVPAAELADAVKADQTAAAEQYGVAATSGIGAIIPVSFTGVAGEAKGGIYTIDAEGVPDDVTLRVQTGPAITGTDLRDATGDYGFGDFTNQIEYQNAGAALNTAMKDEVLTGLDTSDLAGKTVEVTGVFNLINPSNWMVTPVEIAVR